MTTYRLWAGSDTSVTKQEPGMWAKEEEQLSVSRSANMSVHQWSPALEIWMDLDHVGPFYLVSTWIFDRFSVPWASSSPSDTTSSHSQNLLPLPTNNHPCFRSWGWGWGWGFTLACTNINTKHSRKPTCNQLLTSHLLTDLWHHSRSWIS